MNRLPKIIATSVVRGSQQGESHGGVFLIDFANQEILQTVDWNKGDIDFTGRGWDRGLRGIAFYKDDIYIAASDELFVYDQEFRIRNSFRNPYLKHCHEIAIRDHLMLLTSTGFDSLLVFDLDRRRFVRGLWLAKTEQGWESKAYDPNSDKGPAVNNQMHINSVTCTKAGIFVSGLRTGALLQISGDRHPGVICDLPEGTHNAQLYRAGVMFNDTGSDALRYVARDGTESAFRVQTYDADEIEFAGVDDSTIARQGFGRGLCAAGDSLIVGGSSPSTVSVYDVDAGQRVAAVNLSMDIRNSIHGLEVWPFS